MEDREMRQMESSLKSLRIADIEIFISAARLKNLGRSARSHHLSQSAASTAVQRVESAFGQPLCTHEKRHFALTKEGQHLLPKMERWVKQLRKLVVQEEEMGLRLVTTHAIAHSVVPALYSLANMEFTHMRPDHAYGALLQDEADIALVLDNAAWKGVVAAEVGRGYFQLYSRNKEASLQPVLLPEEQMEGLFLQQSFHEVHRYPLPVKCRIPSWTLIASICADSDEVGFLPDFLAKQFNLHPVLWQPAPFAYRILALSRTHQSRYEPIYRRLRDIF